MYGENFFLMALIYLLAAVISVPIARKIGLGSVFGYLLAGIVIGPYVLGWVGQDQEKVMHFAEFGVVMMLFLIGLEMQPSVLWKMRRTIFGMGGTQTLLTALVIGIVSHYSGFKLHQSIAIGLIMALSSTAIVLQTLDEKGLLKNSGGRASFSVLLFQDIAVIPILALLPLLAQLGGVGQIDNGYNMHETGFQSLNGIVQLLLIVSGGALVIFFGRIAARHIFRMVAETGTREVFTASALLLIIGAALGTSAIGLSPALGTFVAGVVLADNEYRHELEITVEPFKGLLLGLFFISVGASINFALLVQKPFLILGFVCLLIILKFSILYITGRLWGLRNGREILFSLALAQAGEFGFVLVSFSDQIRIFDAQTSSMLIIIIILSMTLTPFLLMLNEKVFRPRYVRKKNKEIPDEIPETGNKIIIAGFGRFGLVVGRLLMANGFKVTILDGNPANVEILRKHGFKLFYGDITRPEMLEAAGVKDAKMLILTMAEYDEALKIAGYLKKHYPNLKIAARARDTIHAFEFYKLGLNMVQRETFNSAVELGSKILSFMGFTRYQAFRAARTFKHHEDDIMYELYQHWLEDENRFIQETRRFSEQLDELLQTEHEFSIHDTDYAWDNTTSDDEDTDPEQ
jgi:monovalent cation:proton antiporter-2 (CPA2) family protein